MAYLASRQIGGWRLTRWTVARLDELVRDAVSGDATEVAARYADVFAENVELDVPLARRVEYLKQGLVNLGALRPAAEPLTPKTPRPSVASWTVHAEYGRLELYIELAPVAPFGVQTFSAEIKNGQSRIELF